MPVPARPIVRPITGDRAVALTSLRALVAALSGSARAVESRTGLTNAQLFLMRQMVGHESLSINDLAALANTRQNTVSSVVGRLVRLGLIRKVQSPDDRRRAAVSLSPKGVRLLAKAPPSPTETLIAGITALRAGEARALASGLTALVAALKLDVDAAPLLFEEGQSRG